MPPSGYDFYAGYEGEPEIRFSMIGENGVEEQCVRAWIGYFDALMARIPPEPMGWTGLALPYHLHTGWYDESPWTIAALQQVCSQWRAIDTQSLGGPYAAVHAAVLSVLEEALRQNKAVVITYE